MVIELSRFELVNGVSGYIALRRRDVGTIGKHHGVAIRSRAGARRGPRDRVRNRGAGRGVVGNSHGVASRVADFVQLPAERQVPALSFETCEFPPLPYV